MKDKSYIKCFRLLSGLFDLAIIYIISFFVLSSTIINLSLDLINNGFLSSQTINNILIMVPITLAIIFLYLFIPSVIFKGTTLGEKIFLLDCKNVTGENVTVSTITLRVLCMEFFFIFTLGLSLISDIITIVISKSSRTVVDKIIRIYIDKSKSQRSY